MLNSKKRNIFIVSIFAFILLLLAGCTSRSGESKEIMRKFNNYFNSKERTVIYYASTTCGWCSLQTPILETIAEDYDLDYVYVDTSKLSKSQAKEVADKLGIGTSTPTTVVVENKKVIDVANGFKPAKDYIAFFVENDLLPEDAEYSKEKNLTFIEYEEYESLVKQNGSHIIVAGQTTCSHCIAIKPALNSIVEDYDIKINYIDVNLFTKEEYNGFVQSLTDIGYNDKSFVEEGSFGTPLILIVKNGKLSTYIAGERSKSQLVKEFKKAGLI